MTLQNRLKNLFLRSFLVLPESPVTKLICGEIMSVNQRPASFSVVSTYGYDTGNET